MKIKVMLFLLLFSVQCLFASEVQQAVLVNNSMEEINTCKDKMQLKLIRIWGGADEEDENKFFETPRSIAVGADKSIYVCDWHNHCIRVFDYSGKYLRTIGRKGRGPGDIYGPYSIAISPDGNLMVNEVGGRRIQWFSPEGKSLRIMKNKVYSEWIGITSTNELVVYSHDKTFETRKLISICDNKGELIREIGAYHDKAKNIINSETLKFSIDSNDNIYAANIGTPVIRRYSPQGKLIMAITFDTPYDIPAGISLNPGKNEIQRKGEGEENKVEVHANKNSVSFQSLGSKGKKWPIYGICSGIGTDSQKRIYIVTRRRRLTEKEALGKAVSGSMSGRLNRKMVNFDIVENIDVNRLLVFNPDGKVAADVCMTTFCDDIYIYNDRIFIVDGILNQRILEYEIIFI